MIGACVLNNPTKIHQMVMNLCTNGGKAMPDGGILSISLNAVYLKNNMILHGSSKLHVSVNFYIFYYVKVRLAAPQSRIMRIISLKLSPRSVREYSTLGGTSA